MPPSFPKEYRVRWQMERVWPREPGRAARLEGYARLKRRIWALVQGFMMCGALLGALLASWQGYRLYGPAGIASGAILGSIGGAFIGLITAVLLPLMAIAGIVWAVVGL